MKPNQLIAFTSTLLLSLAATAAHATMYNVTGVMTANTSTSGVAPFNTSSWLILHNYPGGNWTPHIVEGANYSAVNIAVSGSLDITGTTINSGALSIANYSLEVLLGDFFGANVDLAGVTQSFGAAYGTAGWAQTAGGVVAGSCNGNAAFVICDAAAAGQPALDYALTNNGGGLYSLQLRLGALTNEAGALTTRFFTLQATPAAVPIPAGAWLFGSALVGLAGTRRRKK